MARLTKKEIKEKDLIWQQYLKECQDEFDKENKIKKNRRGEVVWEKKI